MAPAPELLDRLRDALLPRAEVLEAYLHGSRARGPGERHSDVDVAVYVDAAKVPESPFGYEAHLTADLMRALGVNEVDVVVLNGAPPLLYHRVLRDGVRVLSRDLRATTVREGRALSRWCDWVPQLQKIDAVLNARSRDDGGRR